MNPTAPEIEQWLNEAADFVKSRLKNKPQAGVVLGSGLGSLADKIEQPIEIAYEEIPHFPRSTVAGHSGRLVAGSLGGLDIVAMKGRVHYYEGYAGWQLLFPMRLMVKLGIRAVLLSNAAGSVRPDFSVGNIMVISDHINNLGFNALVGPHHENWGSRFVDMAEPYDPDLSALLSRCAAEQGLTAHHGIYQANSGPVYETKAEVRLARNMGADAVGMSTVWEVMAAGQAGVKTAAFSLLTNYGAGLAAEVNHEEVMQIGTEKGPALAEMAVSFFKELRNIT